MLYWFFAVKEPLVTAVPSVQVKLYVPTTLGETEVMVTEPVLEVSTVVAEVRYCA